MGRTIPRGGHTKRRAYQQEGKDNTKRRAYQEEAYQEEENNIERRAT